MFTLKKHISLLVLCFVGLVVQAQVIQPAAKPSLKVNYERLKRIDNLINGFVQSNSTVISLPIIEGDKNKQIVKANVTVIRLNTVETAAKKNHLKDAWTSS